MFFSFQVIAIFTKFSKFLPSIAIYSQVCLKLVSVVYLSYLQACWNLELRKQTQKEKKRKIQEKCKENKKMVEQVGAVEKGKGCVLV